MQTYMFLELDLGEGHTWLLISPHRGGVKPGVSIDPIKKSEKRLFVRLPATGEKKRMQAQPVACGVGGSGSLFAGCKYHKPPVPTIVFLDLRQTQPWPSEAKQVKTGARQWGSIKSRKAIKVGERCVRPGGLSRKGKQDG